MAVKVANKPKLPRANVRDPANPFPADQYVKVSNVAIFSEHETKTPEGQPQRFDQHVLKRLIDRGNQRIEASGDYSAVCVGHTHDPDDPDGAEEQPEVIGGMGPYRLGLLGNPGSQQKYAILADLWIRKDKINKYNAHPRRSVELWYEHDQPAWIDPLSLLTETPRLDLGLTPLIPESAGNDGAELKYLYSANAGGLRRVKYAAAFPSAGSVFVPAEGDKPKHYAAGGPAETQPEKEDLMLAPEDIRQICDAIEQLDVITAMRDFMPMIPRVKELLTTEAEEHASMQPGQPGAELPEAGAEPAAPIAPEPTPAAPTGPTGPTEPSPEKLPEDLKKVPHSAEGAVASEKKDGTPSDHLKDMKEEDIERYLCQRNATKYAAMFGTVDGTPEKQPAEGKVEEAPGVTEGTADAAKAKYSMMETRLAELEAERVARINEARKQQLTTLRYHRAFDLDKAIVRCDYAKMSDADFKSHTGFIAESCTPTNANAPLPVPDALLDSAQPPPAVRQGPEKYTKDKADEAVRICYEKQKEGKSVSYALVLDAIVNGQPIPE